MADINSLIIFYAILGGLIPSLIWLYFWLKEDCHPEPKRLLFLAFLAGILAIPLALLLEILWQKYIIGIELSEQMFIFLLIFGFAFFEEFSKFIFTKKIIFWRRDFDEPVDAMIYLMTAALGFASLENILYLIPEFASSLEVGIGTGNLRFLGATLLHTLSSGVLGFFVAHRFCSERKSRIKGIILGLFSATLIHTLFNFLILQTDGVRLAPVLILLSITGIFLIFAFEHIKKVHQTCPGH